MDDFARAQIEALERRVEELERHVGLHRDRPAVDPQIAELLHAGRMVQAIKLYHETHGVDLMAAKVAIERIHAQGGY